jgi:hypothetical protein
MGSRCGTASKHWSEGSESGSCESLAVPQCGQLLCCWFWFWGFAFKGTALALQPLFVRSNVHRCDLIENNPVNVLLIGLQLVMITTNLGSGLVNS